MCVNNLCSFQFSLPVNSLVDTSDPSVCATGYSVKSNQFDNLFICLPPPKTTGNVLKGLPNQSSCQVSYFTESSSVIIDTVNATCGYNKDSDHYCPWQLGDLNLQEIIKEIHEILPLANKMCGS
jgi:hypothetical protein